MKHILQKSTIGKTERTKEIPSNECPLNGCTVDLEWYRANGYVSAEEFFERMRSKYGYTTKV